MFIYSHFTYILMTYDMNYCRRSIYPYLSVLILRLLNECLMSWEDTPFTYFNVVILVKKEVVFFFVFQSQGCN